MSTLKIIATDPRYGNEGGGVWALPVGVLGAGIVAVEVTELIIRGAQQHQGSLLIIGAIAGLFFWGLCMLGIFLIYSSTHCVQHGTLKGANDLEIRPFLGRTKRLDITEIKKITNFRYSKIQRFLLPVNLLSPTDDNYVIHLYNKKSYNLNGKYFKTLVQAIETRL